jgi:hypothetical protein
MRLRPLRIALDPELRASCGPELAWSWRLLLTAMGRSWVEVAAEAEADIAHLGAGRGAGGTAPILIRADRERWRRRENLLLLGAEEHDGWSLLDFGGASHDPPAVTGPDGQLVIDHDLVLQVFWLATALAETGWERNAHGHPQPSGPLLEQRLFPRALASGIASRLDAALLDLGFAAGAPRWPRGKRAAACLTHDVDYPEAVRWLEPLRVLRRRGREGLKPALEVMAGRRSTWQFGSWTRMEERLGARSAFYFVPRKGSLHEYATGTPDSFYDITTPRFGELFRQLDAAGAEVGLHASYHAFESEQGFAAEKARLERAAGIDVVGNRHHYLHLDPSHPEETLLMHERLGFAYDTTLGHDRHLGWRNSLALPFFPFHRRLRREVGALQLPFAWMDQQLLQYGALNPGEPRDLLGELVTTTAAQAGCLVVNIHEYTFDDELFPGWSRTYEALVRQLSERGDFWLATPRTVAEHWRARTEAIAAESTGLDDGAAARAPVRSG